MDIENNNSVYVTGKFDDRSYSDISEIDLEQDTRVCEETLSESNQKAKSSHSLQTAKNKIQRNHKWILLSVISLLVIVSAVGLIIKKGQSVTASKTAKQFNGIPLKHTSENSVDSDVTKNEVELPSDNKSIKLLDITENTGATARVVEILSNDLGATNVEETTSVTETLKPEAVNNSQAEKLKEISQALSTEVPLNEGADVTDFSGDTQLHVAADWNDIETGQKLLKNNANVEDRDKFGRTPLFRAVSAGSLEFTELLLNHSALVNTREITTNKSKSDTLNNDPCARTPLLVAVSHSNLQMTKLLIQHGATIDARDQFGETALHYVAELNNIQIAQLLLNHNANANQPNKIGQTPLYVASKIGSMSLVELLLNHSCQSSAENNGLSPLLMAVENNDFEVAEMLLSKCQDVNAEDTLGKTSLHFAAENDNLEMGQMLLNHSADANNPDVFGRTPLHLAVGAGSKKFAELLLNHSADVNARETKTDPTKLKAGDPMGRTPILISSERNYQDLTELLIEHGADVTISDQFGKTPMHHSARWAPAKIAELLVEAGGNAEVADIFGYTPLQIATSDYWDNTEFAKVFTQENN